MPVQIFKRRLSRAVRHAPRMIVLQILGGYKRWISPFLGGGCRYQPTCSEYAIHAVQQGGVLTGGLMAVWRILRCSPLCAGGYDPVQDYDGGTASRRRDAVAE